MSTSLRQLALLIPLASCALFAQQPPSPAPAPPREIGVATPSSIAPTAASIPIRVFGFRDFTRQAALDREFLAVPSAILAREHLKALTAAPHWASSPEDYATALYVAARFKTAGLDTQIVPYSVLLSKPASLLVEAFDSSGAKIFSGPSPEIPGQPPDAHILPPFNSNSAPGDITAPVVYANYGRRADFERLAQLGISVKGRIVLIRYGQIYRGAKVYIAQQFGAAGVLLYTDPADSSTPGVPDYPAGRNQPATSVQRGSVQFLSIYPGDPTTPGVASTPSLPAADRIPFEGAQPRLQYDLPSVPVQPLSTTDAAPILHALSGPEAPHDWQGAVLGSPYHLGAGPDSTPVIVHLRLAFDTRLRTIWDVIGRIPGSTQPEQLVIAGNHRDAWVYGATDPSSGTAALLETVHGLGVLLAHGWRPRRTLLIASWDAEEEGLMGSTEWVEQHPAELAHAVAYFNIDEAASGPDFAAAAVPSLQQFMREIVAEVPSPAGGSVLAQWIAQQQKAAATAHGPSSTPNNAPAERTGNAPQLSAAAPSFSDLGSGSDYSPFLDHAGVPATNITSDGPFGVYHSTYDNYDWFTRFVDPDLALTIQQSRIVGLEMLHMADADVLPTDELAYAQSIRGYLQQARARAASRRLTLDFAPALAAAESFIAAARAAHALQLAPPANTASLDARLTAAEHALLIPEGIPIRPWYRHAIYAPGLATGYAAEVLPGVNDAIDTSDAPRAQAQLTALTAALTRAADALQPTIK
jgi:N-acetylated-alpha-linked acidic dipeptidase